MVATLCCILYFSTSVSWLHESICSASYWPIQSILCKFESSDTHPPLFYNLGGNGPWIPRANASGIDTDLPEACSVEQAHILLRHAERYPTRNAGARHIALLEKLNDPHLSPRGALSFLRTWSYFTDLTNPSFENLTNSGPYAGTLQAQRTGHKLRQRYAQLISPDTATQFWTCGSPRDVETASHFATGFFGHDWDRKQRAALHIIPETSDRGADTLTPGDTCIQYQEDKVAGHNHGYAKLAQWQHVFSAKIASRLSDDLGGLTFTSVEVYGMMEMCGFEILARGYSPWCDVFSQEEWSQFEYARDLLHFYRAGPGNKYAGAMGQLWLDAVSEVMTRQVHQGVYSSFVHDSDIVAVIAALGVLDEVGTEQHLPTHRVKTERRWKTSDVTPMGGYLMLEKVQCSSEVGVGRKPTRLVRLWINDGLFDLGNIITSSEVEGATTFEQFVAYLQKRSEQFGSFIDTCALSKDARSRITFF